MAQFSNTFITITALKEHEWISGLNIEILQMTGKVNPQRLEQRNTYLFLHYKQLTIFDHPYYIHKSLDSEPSTFLLVNGYVILINLITIFSYI